jgi:ketosteroid isomerase-like protein
MKPAQPFKLPLAAAPPPFADNDAAIRWMVDRIAITDTVNEWGTALDTRDWDLFGDIITDPIEMEFPTNVGSKVFSRADLVEMATPFFSRLDATQHLITNHQITVDGDEATCAAALYAQHHLAAGGDDSVQRQIGFYVHRLRREDRWRIWRAEQHVRWHEGNEDVYEYMQGRLPEFPGGEESR